MTAEQLAVARRNRRWHAERYGYPRSNVEFIDGDIERLSDLPLDAESFDVVVSNCVLNLCEQKDVVLGAVHRLLKPGGEFYFSDVYADRRLPATARSDPRAHAECLGGALYWNDFLQLATGAGFRDPRLVAHRKLEIGDRSLMERLAPAVFHSATYRLFKIEGLEAACEDYGQAVIYRGGVEHAEQNFVLDAHHHVAKGRVFQVCGNTYRMLNQSRFAPFFEFIGDWSTHFGIYPGCGTSSPFVQRSSAEQSSGACC
jgi:SAM-dependent methyltransferase